MRNIGNGSMSDATAAMKEIVSSHCRSGQPDETFRQFVSSVSRLVDQTFTTMLVIRPGEEGDRIFTTNTEIYPIPHRKPLPANGWVDRIVGQRKPFLVRTVEEHRRVFRGTDDLVRAGCGCLLNMPVIFDDAVIGVVNVAHVENAYSEDTVALLTPLVAALAPTFALVLERSPG